MAAMEKTDVPGVYKRGGRYAYSYRKRGRQRWGSARTKAEARRLKRNAETDVERGDHRESSRITFGDYAREWVEHYQGRTSRGFRESTRRWYRQMLEQRLIPYFDAERELRLTQIEPRDVKALVRWLAEQSDPRRPGIGLSRSTIQGHIAVVRALFADAVEEGVLRASPAAGVRVALDGRGPSAAEPKERRALTRDELRRLLGELAPEWRLFFEVLAQTGVRIGEAVELRAGRDLKLGARPRIEVRWQYVNGEVCRPKSRYGCRDIPLSPAIARRLWQLGRRDGELLFTTSVRTRLNRHNLARDVLKPAGARADVPWATLHTFRHTCASLLFAAGKNPKQVQEWLGHHDAAFTLRTYVHLLEDGVGDAGFFDAIVELEGGESCEHTGSENTPEPGSARPKIGAPEGANENANTAFRNIPKATLAVGAQNG